MKMSTDNISITIVIPRPADLKTLAINIINKIISFLFPPYGFIFWGREPEPIPSVFGVLLTILMVFLCISPYFAYNPLKVRCKRWLNSKKINKQTFFQAIQAMKNAVCNKLGIETPQILIEDAMETEGIDNVAAPLELVENVDTTIDHRPEVENVIVDSPPEQPNPTQPKEIVENATVNTIEKPVNNDNPKIDQGVNEAVLPSGSNGVAKPNPTNPKRRPNVNKNKFASTPTPQWHR